jgi:hypothetical protein
MILFHQSLNNLDVVIILFRIKTAYVYNFVCSFQSFFHSSVLSFFCSFVFYSFAFFLFFRSRSFFVHSRFFLCLFVARFKIKSKENNKNVCLI